MTADHADVLLEVVDLSMHFSVRGGGAVEHVVY